MHHAEFIGIQEIKKDFVGFELLGLRYNFIF